MTLEGTSNQHTLDMIEMGEKTEEINSTSNGETKQLIMDGTSSFSEKQDSETPKDSKPSGADFLPGVGACDVHYDDEDWQSDDDNNDIDDKGKCEKRRPAPNETNIVARIVLMVQRVVICVNNTFQRLTKGYFWFISFILLYFAYFTYAMFHSFGDEHSWRLLMGTVIGIIVMTRHRVSWMANQLFVTINGSDRLGPRKAKAWNRFKFGFQWTMNLALLCFMVYNIVSVGMKDIKNLRSLPGLFVFLLVCLLFSTNPKKIDWYVIYWSLGLQFLLAFLALKGDWGRQGVLWVQQRLDEFFDNSKAASKLIFGDSYADHYMIFSALPLVFLMNATLVLLYYSGAMQLFIRVIGMGLKFVLHTSPIECVSVAGGIFMEGALIILTLRPFLGSLSKSEMFVVITSGLASLGGTYVAILAGFGVSLKYIIPAMLVSAPATFAVCKLMVPENLEKKGDEDMENVKNVLGKEERQRYSNVLDAMQGGAVSVLGLLGSVIAVAFVFFSYISWINHTIEWFGDRAGVEKLSIEIIFSYILYPVSMAMGVALDDCRRVAMLLGYRIGSSNIIAFFKLREMKGNKVLFDQYMTATNFTGPVSYYRDDVVLDSWNKTLTNGFLSDRSEAIVTYCLCGFSSAISAGILMSYLMVMLPRRRKWLTKMTIPAIIAGNIANCMTGCFAGIVY